MTSSELDPAPEWLGRMLALEDAAIVERMRRSQVLCVGLGGVGGLAAELVARLGVGAMTIVDGDVVEATNINRQIPALTSTLGQSKTVVMADRLMDINPKLKLTVMERFLSPEDMPGVLNTGRYTCVLDAIDSVPSKIALLVSRARHIFIAESKSSPTRTPVSALRIRNFDLPVHAEVCVFSTRLEPASFCASASLGTRFASASLSRAAVMPASVAR